MYHRRSEIPRRGAAPNATSQQSGADSCAFAQRLHAHTMEKLAFLRNQTAEMCMPSWM